MDVDDEESIRRVTEVRLAQAGYQVGVASNVTEALAALAKQHYDLVLTDLRMPGASGLDLLRKLRADYPDIAVVLGDDPVADG